MALPAGELQERRSDRQDSRRELEQGREHDPHDERHQERPGREERPEERDGRPLDPAASVGPGEPLLIRGGVRGLPLGGGLPVVPDLRPCGGRAGVLARDVHGRGAQTATDSNSLGGHVPYLRHRPQRLDDAVGEQVTDRDIDRVAAGDHFTDGREQLPGGGVGR